jgi:hypothetical protein
MVVDDGRCSHDPVSYLPDFFSFCLGSAAQVNPSLGDSQQTGSSRLPTSPLSAWFSEAAHDAWVAGCTIPVVLVRCFQRGGQGLAQPTDG